MARPRAADDFAAIRARIEELRREREGTTASDDSLEPRRGDAQRLLGRLQVDLIRRRQRI